MGGRGCDLCACVSVGGNVQYGRVGKKVCLDRARHGAQSGPSEGILALHVHNRNGCRKLLVTILLNV